MQEEIVAALRLGAGGGLVRAVTSFDRPNLHYEAMERSGSLGPHRALADAVARCRCRLRARGRAVPCAVGGPGAGRKAGGRRGRKGRLLRRPQTDTHTSAPASTRARLQPPPTGRRAAERGMRHATIVYALSHKETERVAETLVGLGMPPEQVAPVPDPRPPAGPVPMFNRSDAGLHYAHKAEAGPMPACRARGSRAGPVPASLDGRVGLSRAGGCLVRGARLRRL